MGLAKLGEGDAVIAVRKLEDEAASGGSADRLDFDSGSMSPCQEGEQAIVADGREVDALILAEQAGGAARYRLVDDRADWTQ